MKSFINLVLFLGIFIASIAYYIDSWLAMFVYNFILLLLIVLRSRISFFSLKAVICFYVLIPVFFQETTGESIGILQVSNFSLEVLLINLILFIYLFINLVFVNNSKILVKEKELFVKLTTLNTPALLFFSVLAILFIIIYYPPHILSNGDRFYHLLPGNFWNHLSVIFLIFTLPSIKRKKLAIIPWIFVIGWCFIKKERVDSLGLIVLLLIAMFHFEIISKRMFYLILIIFVVTFAFLGMYRIGADINGIRDAFKTVLIQSTAADIAYLLNISIHYVKDYGCAVGYTYINYLYELLPIGTSNFDASLILNKIYGHPGGIHLLSEPYMNFGIIGVIIYSFIECLFYSWFFRKKNKIVLFYYCFFIVSSFRYCWYGLRYIETASVYLLPISYQIYRMFDYKRRGVYVNNKIKIQNKQIN